MRRLWVAMGLVVVAAATPARANVVLVGSERAPAFKEAIEAAQKSAPAISFADEESVDAAEQLRHAEVILAVGVRALLLARTVAADKPVVYALVPAAEVQPGKLVTGVALEVPAYAVLAQWKQLRYDGLRVALVYDKAAPAVVADAARAAAALGMTLSTRAVDGAAQLDAALDEVAPKADAVWIAAAWPAASTAVTKWRARVALLGNDDAATAAGALFSLASDPRDIGRRAARLALGIAGRAPGERVPVPAPATSMGALTINAASAAALGIELPEAIVKKARKIYR